MARGHIASWHMPGTIVHSVPLGLRYRHILGSVMFICTAIFLVASWNLYHHIFGSVMFLVFSPLGISYVCHGSMSSTVNVACVDEEVCEPGGELKSSCGRHKWLGDRLEGNVTMVMTWRRSTYSAIKTTLMDKWVVLCSHPEPGPQLLDKVVRSAILGLIILFPSISPALTSPPHAFALAMASTTATTALNNRERTQRHYYHKKVLRCFWWTS